MSITPNQSFDHCLWTKPQEAKEGKNRKKVPIEKTAGTRILTWKNHR